MDEQLKIIFTEELEKGWRFETEEGLIIVGTGEEKNKPLLESIS